MGTYKVIDDFFVGKARVLGLDREIDSADFRAGALYVTIGSRKLRIGLCSIRSWITLDFQDELGTDTVSLSADTPPTHQDDQSSK